MIVILKIFIFNQDRFFFHFFLRIVVISVFMFYRVLLCNNAQLIWWLNNIRWLIILDVNKTYLFFLRCIDSKANMNNAGGWWRQNSHFLIKVKSLSRGQPRTVIKFNSIQGKFQPLGFWPLKQSPLFTPILPIPGLAEGLLTNQRLKRPPLVEMKDFTSTSYIFMNTH